MNSTGLLQRSAVACMVGAAMIHLGVASDHFAEWWVYGVFFLALASFQIVWSILAWQSQHRTLLISGAVVNAATLVLWAVTRTTGLPFGPDAGTAEVMGSADLVCAGLELASAVLTVVALRRLSAPTAPASGTMRRADAFSGGVLVLVLLGSGVAIAAPGEHDDVMGMDDTSPHSAGMDDDMATGNGSRHEMAELPDVSEATTPQTAAARELLTKTIAATAKYRDTAVAKADGYDLRAALAKKAKKSGGDKLASALHVPNQKLRSDGTLADPDAPETLIYSQTATDTFMLIGVMFTAEKKDPPAVYEPYMRWHFHEGCKDGKREVKEAKDGACPAGAKATKSGYMTHLWFVSTGDLVYAYAMVPPRHEIMAYQRSLT